MKQQKYSYALINYTCRMTIVKGTRSSQVLSSVNVEFLLFWAHIGSTTMIRIVHVVDLVENINHIKDHVDPISFDT